MALRLAPFSQREEGLSERLKERHRLGLQKADLMQLSFALTRVLLDPDYLKGQHCSIISSI